MSTFEYNKRAWDREVEKGNRWTLPVTPGEIAAAREGNWSLVLTPKVPVPRRWFPDDLRGVEVLCLASGGGQQGPILAAAGAEVTVLDASPRQLDRDREVAARDGLTLEVVEGDMQRLPTEWSERFDLIVHPCSNSFVPDVRPVWREAYRVLRKGGALLAGMCNPVMFTTDPDLEQKGVFTLKYKVPYSDLTSLTDEERRRYTDAGEPLAFGHTLGDQIGGQIDAGFVISGFYEDREDSGWALNEIIPCFFATRSVKM